MKERWFLLSTSIQWFSKSVTTHSEYFPLIKCVPQFNHYCSAYVALYLSVCLILDSDKVKKKVLGFGVWRVWGKFFIIQLQMMLAQDQAAF